jgi:sugar O-acyltransferase (sialic acid O-acetyltransferase NeuD family)
MEIYIAGAGGLGREAYDAALAAGVSVRGFLDDARSGTVVRGLPVFAPEQAETGFGYLIGIADPAVRARFADLLDSRGLTAVTIVHPRAVIGPETTLGAGTLVLANAHISSSVYIGRHSQVHYNATVGHDAVLADWVTMYPGSNVSGSVALHSGVTVGSNAVVLQGLTVGADSFVGAAAVVTRNVAPGLVMVGSPARVHLRRSAA